MEKLSMCRICLIKDVRLHCLVNTRLQEIYEFLSGNLLETKDRRPLHACYMCCTRLGNCLRLRTACLHSEELFSHLLENDSCEVTPSQGMNMLQTTPVMNINVGPVVQRELKMDPSQMTDEQNEQINQGICTQFIKQEDMKSENVSSEDEELDCSIQSIKVESNSASDSSLEYGMAPESYDSECNQNISSVDRKDILSGNPVKVVLHRTDLNGKAATGTEHFNPTDLEYTSQCNNFNYSKNVEISKPNICEEYKQIVYMSSETHSDSCKDLRTDTGDTIYKCSLSEKSFTKKSVLNVHFRRTHKDEKPHMCDKCGRSFTHKCNLLVHICSQTGEKPFQCTTCDKCFYTSYSLTRHIRTHTGEKPFRCPTCDKSFSILSHLTLHICTHTGEKPYKCDTCEKGFSQMNHLSQHIRIHTGEKPYKCNTCAKSFRYKKILLEHISTHTSDRPFKCDTCGKGFTRKSRLSQHTRTHTGEKLHKCHTCGKDFIRKTDLLVHIRIHTGEKPFKCDTCGKYFSQQGTLSQHIRTHASDRPYKCYTCGKGFTRKSKLSQHTRTHTGEKPYKCDACGKEFSQMTNLSRHIRIHTGEKPYKCVACGKCFNEKKSLSVHISSKKYKCSLV